MRGHKAMKSYADYSFYVEIYGGQMNEEEFQKAILEASQHIRYMTMGKADDYEGDELKYAACEAADILQAIEGGQSAAKAEKKSETTDGYSVSYVTQGKDGETLETTVGRKIYSALRKWLAPTGLLYTGVGCCYAHKHRYYDLSSGV